MSGAGSGSTRPRAHLRTRARVGVPALGPRSGLARGGGRRREQMARPRLVPGGAACGAVRLPGPWRPSRFAALEGLCAVAPALDGDAAASTRGGERVPTARSCPRGLTGLVKRTEWCGISSGASGASWEPAVVGGHCAGPQWTPSKEPGAEEAGLPVPAGKREPSGPARGGLGGLFVFIGR